MKLLKRFVLSQMGNNCFLVEANGKIILIDAPAGINRVTSYLDQNDLKLDYVVITHVHFDHVMGLDYLQKEGYISEVYVPNDEIAMLLDDSERGNMGGQFDCHIKYDGVIRPLSELDSESLGMKIAYISGHSPQSAVFIFEQLQMIFSGDTLFKASIGRSDFYGGDVRKLQAGIQTEIMCYEDYKVYPGHGFATNTEQERNNHLIYG